MKCISWNINGYRSGLSKGIDKQLLVLDPDIICLQEIKANSEDMDTTAFNDYYYYIHSAQKKGYSGTLVFSKKEPLNVFYGLDNFDDIEGRVITLEFNHFYLVNVYVPNSQTELKRLSYRQQWDTYFIEYLTSLSKRKNVLVCGDFNVAHHPIDIKNPKANEKNAGYTNEERQDFDNLLNHNFIDTFRYLNPELIKYSWWSYRFNSRNKNIGWRIDYWLVNQGIENLILNSDILTDWLGSDHAPILLEVKDDLYES